MTYFALNLIFLTASAVALVFIRTKFQLVPTALLALPMLGVTSIFDNLIILSGIVDYDTTKLFGIYLGVVPIEDFAYTVVAVLLVPTIWKVMTK
jgi:lycopene cyclase domain-containing protein